MPRGREKRRKSLIRRAFDNGLTLPGYKYLGPFNSLDNGDPTNQSDRAAQAHDRRYSMYQQLHGRFAPYLKFNHADQEFIDNVGSDWGGRIGKGFFEFKKRFAPALDEQPVKRGKSEVPSTPNKTNKRLREPTLEPQNKKFKGETPTQSLLNLQRNSQPLAVMGETKSGSGLEAGLTETPVDRVRQVQRGPPEYVFASLPYVRDMKAYVTAFAYDFGFRMTSCYDPSMTSASSIDLNAGAGSASVVSPVVLDSSDTSITSARWFDYYSTLYNYYHVVAAKWHVMIENLSHEPIWVHQGYYNDELPPQGATNEDIMCWNDYESHFVGSHAQGADTNGVVRYESVGNLNNVEGAGTAGTTTNFTTGNMVTSRGTSPILKLSGEYRPGQFSRQIHLDSEVENWTAIDANPSLPERLLLRFKPYWNALDTNDANSYNRAMQFRITFKIDYLVEFKELKAGLRWPVERQPVIAAVNTNLEEDEE